MIAARIVLVVMMSSLVTIVAHLFEYFAVVHRSPRRFIWIASSCTTLCMTVAILAVRVPQEAVNLIGHNTGSRLPSWVTAVLDLSTQARESPRTDWSLGVVWSMLSVATLTFYFWSWIRLQVAARRWCPATYDKTAVWVSQGEGPAVVGFIQPRIVVPAWLRQCDSHTRSALLAHEREHIKERDHFFFLAEIVLRVVIPWNILLCCQLDRLHISIEADCDSRVLRQSAIDRVTYTNALLTVWRLSCSLKKEDNVVPGYWSELGQRLRGLRTLSLCEPLRGAAPAQRP